MIVKFQRRYGWIISLATISVSIFAALFSVYSYNNPKPNDEKNDIKILKEQILILETQLQKQSSKLDILLEKDSVHAPKK